MAPQYSIRPGMADHHATNGRRSIDITSDGCYTPAEAMQFALKIIQTAQTEGVIFVNPDKNHTRVGV